MDAENNKEIRVVFISTLYPSRIHPHKGIFTKNLFKYFPENIKLTVISPVPYYPFFIKKNRIIKEEDEDVDYRVIRPVEIRLPFRFTLIFRPFFSFLSIFFSCRTVIKDADVVYSNFAFPDGFTALLFSKLFRKKFILTVEGSDVNMFLESADLFFFVKKVLIDADKVIAVSSLLSEKVKKIRQYDIEIPVIHNGYDDEKFYIIDRTEVRKRLGFSENEGLILTVAALRPVKNLNSLIKTMALLQKKKSCKLYIIGDGPDKNKLEQLVNELNLNNKVIFISFVENKDLINWYNACDVFCLPSLNEGSPTVIAEAGACGCPVAASSVGGIPELLKNKASAVLFQPLNIDDMADKLYSLLQKNINRNEIAGTYKDLSFKVLGEKMGRVIGLIYSGCNSDSTVY